MFARRATGIYPQEYKLSLELRVESLEWGQPRNAKPPSPSSRSLGGYVSERGIVKLFFFGLAKVLGVAFGNHLGIMQVLSVVDEVEKRRALSGGNRLLSSDVNGFCGLGFV